MNNSENYFIYIYIYKIKKKTISLSMNFGRRSARLFQAWRGAVEDDTVFIETIECDYHLSTRLAQSTLLASIHVLLGSFSLSTEALRWASSAMKWRSSGTESALKIARESISKLAVCRAVPWRNVLDFFGEKGMLCVRLLSLQLINHSHELSQTSFPFSILTCLSQCSQYGRRKGSWYPFRFRSTN